MDEPSGRNRPPVLRRTASALDRLVDHLRSQLEDLVSRSYVMASRARELQAEQEVLREAQRRIVEELRDARVGAVEQQEIEEEVRFLDRRIGAVRIKVTVVRDSAQKAAFVKAVERMEELRARTRDAWEAVQTSPGVEALAAELRACARTVRQHYAATQPEPDGPADVRYETVLSGCTADDRKDLRARWKELAASAAEAERRASGDTFAEQGGSSTPGVHLHPLYAPPVSLGDDSDSEGDSPVGDDEDAASPPDPSELSGSPLDSGPAGRAGASPVHTGGGVRSALPRTANSSSSSSSAAPALDAELAARLPTRGWCARGKAASMTSKLEQAITKLVLAAEAGSERLVVVSHDGLPVEAAALTATLLRRIGTSPRCDEIAVLDTAGHLSRAVPRSLQGGGKARCLAQGLPLAAPSPREVCQALVPAAGACLSGNVASSRAGPGGVRFRAIAMDWVLAAGLAMQGGAAAVLAAMAPAEPVSAGAGLVDIASLEAAAGGDAGYSVRVVAVDTTLPGGGRLSEALEGRAWLAMRLHTRLAVLAAAGHTPAGGLVSVSAGASAGSGGAATSGMEGSSTARGSASVMAVERTRAGRVRRFRESVVISLGAVASDGGWVAELGGRSVDVDQDVERVAAAAAAAAAAAEGQVGAMQTAWASGKRRAAKPAAGNKHARAAPSGLIEVDLGDDGGSGGSSDESDSSGDDDDDEGMLV